MSAPEKPAGGGYKNPPQHTKFKKGQSGNPKGRPKGAKGFKTLFAKALKSPITIQEGGKKKRVRRSEALVKGIVNDALLGRDRPRDTVLRYADSLDQEQQALPPEELAVEDQAILERYVRRRLRELVSAKRKHDHDSE